jgi:hypothetical protein
VITKKHAINISEDERVVPWQPAIDRGAPGTGVFKVPGLEKTFFRGEERCVMLQNEKSFGSVCRWGMVMAIHRHVRAIDEYGANDRPIPAKYIPTIKVKLLTPASAEMKVKWGYKTVKPEEAKEAMQAVRAKDYTFDTFNWTPLRAENDEKSKTSSAQLEALPKGTHVVTCFTQDLNPWIYSDLWQLSMDSRSWIVQQAT